MKSEILLSLIKEVVKNEVKTQVKEQLGKLINIFIEASMAVSFASTYNLIDVYNNLTAANEATQAADLLPQIEKKITFMQQAYADAIEKNQSQTPAFIDFEQDLSYLLQYLEKAKKNALVQQMCNNFAKAMNFTETQQLFFSHRKIPNDSQFHTVNEQMIVDYLGL
jgi:hypothetical protein